MSALSIFHAQRWAVVRNLLFLRCWDNHQNSLIDALLLFRMLVLYLNILHTVVIIICANTQNKQRCIYLCYEQERHIRNIKYFTFYETQFIWYISKPVLCFMLICYSYFCKLTHKMRAKYCVCNYALIHFFFVLQAPEGENQPSTEVDLFVSSDKIMVLNTDLQVSKVFTK